MDKPRYQTTSYRISPASRRMLEKMAQDDERGIAKTLERIIREAFQARKPATGRKGEK